MDGPYISEFKRSYTLEERCKVSSRLLGKFPEFVPVITDYIGLVNDPQKKLEHKHLVPVSSSLISYINRIRKDLAIDSGETLFIFTKNSLIAQNTQVAQLYQSKKDGDGFLYLTVCKENSFG